MRAVIIPDPLEIKIRYLTNEYLPYVIWPDKSISADPTIGLSHMGHVFVNLEQIEDPPTSLHIANGSTAIYNANTYTVTETITYSEPELETMQEVAKAKVLEWRTAKQDGGFTYANVVFQSDFISRTNIEGAVSMALIANMANTPYSVSWTALDNTQMEMDANTVIAFGVTAAQTFQYWHTQSLTLKASIDVANNAADIQTILDSINV